MRLLLALSLLAAGCGVKGYPHPPRPDAEPVPAAAPAPTPAPSATPAPSCPTCAAPDGGAIPESR